MTVAAVILFARPEGALADAAGRPAARRIVESAWAGGATPLVVVSFDDGGRVADSLAGSAAVLAEPAPIETGPVGQIARGIEVALAQVSETDAALLWPGRMAWVDAETVTSLIEAHGARREAILRPRYGAVTGWPVLLPVSLAALISGLSSERMPDELLDDLVAGGATVELIDTGDPGTVNDIATPMDGLPAYDGPPQPVAGHAPEWGSAAADMPDDSPPVGPALAPYSQATEEGE